MVVGAVGDVSRTGFDGSQDSTCVQDVRAPVKDRAEGNNLLDRICGNASNTQNSLTIITRFKA